MEKANTASRHAAQVHADGLKKQLEQRQAQEMRATRKRQRDEAGLAMIVKLDEIIGIQTEHRRKLEERAAREKKEEEQEEMKQEKNEEESAWVCIICYDPKKGQPTACVPCGHVVACNACAPRLMADAISKSVHKCIKCRQPVERYMKLYR